MLGQELYSSAVVFALVHNAEAYIKQVVACEDLEYNVKLTEAFAAAVAKSSSIKENELGDYVMEYMVPLEKAAATAIMMLRQVKATEKGVEGSMKDRLKSLFGRINHALTNAFSALNDKLRAWA